MGARASKVSKNYEGFSGPRGEYYPRSRSPSVLLTISQCFAILKKKIGWPYTEVAESKCYSNLRQLPHHPVGSVTGGTDGTRIRFMHLRRWRRLPERGSHSCVWTLRSQFCLFRHHSARAPLSLCKKLGWQRCGLAPAAESS